MIVVIHCLTILEVVGQALYVRLPGMHRKSKDTPASLRRANVPTKSAAGWTFYTGSRLTCEREAISYVLRKYNCSAPAIQVLRNLVCHNSLRLSAISVTTPSPLNLNDGPVWPFINISATEGMHLLRPPNKTWCKTVMDWATANLLE